MPENYHLKIKRCAKECQIVAEMLEIAAMLENKEAAVNQFGQLVSNCDELRDAISDWEREGK